ncbi:MAG: SGNH/GDSL hydrolase family protein [Nocardioidaceae bacterium]
MPSVPVRLTRTRVRIVVTGLALVLLVAVTTGLWHEESESAGGPLTPVRQDGDAPAALWIGDSYTIGHGARGPAAGYPCLTSDALGWTCQLDAQSGTGFVNAGHRTNEAYVPLGERLEHTSEVFDDPDLVVVDAGRNDRDASAAAFREAAVTYLDRVRSAFPDSELVVVLPFLLGNTDADYEAIDAILREAAADVDATVLDTTLPGWRRMVGSLATTDAIHPTAASHTAIAERLVRDLQRLGIPRDL